MNKTYKLSELAHQLKSDSERLRRWVISHNLPQPDAGRRYTEQQAVKFILAAKFLLSCYTHEQYCRKLKCNTEKLRDLIRVGLVSPPDVALGAKHVYSPSRLTIDAEILNQHPTANKKPYGRRPVPPDRYSKKMVCDIIGIALVSLDYHLSRNRLPKPTCDVKGRYGKYYTEQEKDYIVEWFKTHQPTKAKRGRRKETEERWE